LIWVGVVIIIGIGVFYLNKLLCNKMRKKRANELDDDNYEYDPKDNQSDEKGNKLISNNIKLLQP